MNNCKNLIIVIFFFSWSLMSCAKDTIEPMNSGSRVSKNNTIIVMNIQFLDRFFNISTKKSGIVSSNELKTNTELVKDRLLEQEGNETRLYQPLNYLNNFQFDLQNENGNSKKITRFYRNLYEYETLAIYELSPDNYDLNDISFVTEFFKKSSEKAIYKDFWHKEYQSIDGEYGHWKLEPGKIYYLGSFTFYFKTKRLLYGLMNKFELNKEVKFLGLKIDNQFNQVKKQLLDTKTWFPADGIIDLSGPLKWYHKKDELDLTEFNKTKDKALVETEKVFY